MRLWLKDSERRPDPAPLTTDDRIPVLIGTAGWVVAAAVLLVAGDLIPGFGIDWLVTCAIGVVLGGSGLLYVIRRRS